MLLHVLGHIDADDGILGAEELHGKLLGEIGLAHARGTEEHERADGLTRIFQSDARALYGPHQLIDGIVLPDDGLLQMAAEVAQTQILALPYPLDGDARHHRDDIGDVLLVDR